MKKLFLSVAAAILAFPVLAEEGMWLLPLLKQQKFTIAEVMYLVGFSNHSYFSKCFQSEFGVTPKQYKAD